MIVEPWIFGWIAKLDRRDRLFGFGHTPEEAKANLIAVIAHREPKDLLVVLGELATPAELIGAVAQIRGMIWKCETRAELARMDMKEAKCAYYLRSASHWRQVVKNLEKIMDAPPCS